VKSTGHSSARRICRPAYFSREQIEAKVESEYHEFLLIECDKEKQDQLIKKQLIEVEKDLEVRSMLKHQLDTSHLNHCSKLRDLEAHLSSD